MKLSRMKLSVALGFAALGAVPAPMADAATVAGHWNQTLLESIRQSRIGPPMVARAIAIVHTAGFDAWAAYDEVAVGTRLGGSLRRPPAERTPANREQAFSYAEYRALLDLFPALAAPIRARMTSLGFDPDDSSTDVTTPQGIGNAVAAALLEYRHGDGSNQLGDLHPGPYSDYTGYQPVNQVDHIVDPNRWQPLRFSDGMGGFVVPGCIGPHWGRVTPFALTSTAQFRPEPPALWPSGRYVAQAQEIIHLHAHLDDRQKMIAEYWADGPRSELPPGHWLLFAEYVSDRDGHTFDQDVQLFFTLGNAVFDAGIATWECKMFHDYVRPITAIRFLKAGKKVLATVPFQGKQVIRGEDWLPYQPATFVTPPFPEYPSGHSAFSAAAAEVLKRFTGSDAFGASVTLPAGSSRTEPGHAPQRDVTLSWPTFSAAADQAGMSRRYGGIHFEQGDLASRALGRVVAAAVWEKAQSHIEGNAPPAIATPGAVTPIAAVRGHVTPTVIGQGDAPALAFALSPIAPNPSSGFTRFEFTLPVAARVRMSVVDVRGREIALIAEGSYPAGRHALAWNGTTAGGQAAPGVYFARCEVAGKRLAQRWVLLR